MGERFLYLVAQDWASTAFGLLMPLVTGNGKPVTGLGGAAGYGETQLARSDDGSQRVNVSAVFENGFDLGGRRYGGDALFISTDGLLTFGNAVSGVQSNLSALATPFLAAFHADIDTRLDGEGAESGPIWLDVDPVKDAVTITWASVGFYRRNASQTNTFQVQLFDRGADGMTIALRYGNIDWTSGDLQGGWGGLGGTPAEIAWRFATAGRMRGLTQSGDEAALLKLPNSLGNTGVKGLWVYDIVPVKVITGTADGDLLLGSAGNDLISGGVGDDSLRGGGGEDTLDGGSGVDLVDYADAPAGLWIDLSTPARNTGLAVYNVFIDIEGVIGSAFDDNLTGDAGANRLFGGTGDDRLTGGAGNDLLAGGPGNDLFFGGTGADTLQGGAGFDRVSYANAPASVVVDVTNPRAGQGLAAGDTLTEIEAILGSAFHDRLLGGAMPESLEGGLGHDALFGRGGSDTLIGDQGNDSLDGGSGADALYGGAGWDMASYASAGEAVTVDLATPSRNSATAFGDRFNLIEGLIGSGFADWLFGNGADNILFGGGGSDQLYGHQGQDSLYGDAGDDRLEGGLGADLLDGGAGGDTAVYSAATAGVVVDLALPVQNRGAAAGDRFTAVENIEGSAFADVLAGTRGGNQIAGGAGNDILNGRGGADWLTGGSGFDWASYASAVLAVRVDLARQTGSGEALGDRFFSIEGLIGSRFADDLRGTSLANRLRGGAGNDRLYGQGGADTLQGGAGADLLSGGTGRDLASYADAGPGLVANLATPARNTGIARGDRYQGIEGFYGSRFADKLGGNSGANRLDGQFGNDHLSGGAGNDQLYGGAGKDRLLGGTGADLLYGGTGVDIAEYSDSKSGLVADLLSPRANSGLARGDRYYSVEGLAGSAKADRLLGTTGANLLIGNGGSDRIWGRDGADKLQGGAGRDSLWGGGGGDQFLHSGKAFDGTDVVADYRAAQGDVLLFTGSARRSQFSVHFARIDGQGSSKSEAVITYTPTGQVLWTLTDAQGTDDIYLRLGKTSYDLI